MSQHTYEWFYKEHALRVGGQTLLDAMKRQLSGVDRDVAEWSWPIQLPTPQNPVSVWATIKADWGDSSLEFMVTEEPEAEYEQGMSMNFTVVLGQSPQLWEGVEQEHLDVARLDTLLERFVAVAEPARQVS